MLNQGVFIRVLILGLALFVLIPSSPLMAQDIEAENTFSIRPYFKLDYYHQHNPLPSTTYALVPINFQISEKYPKNTLFKASLISSALINTADFISTITALKYDTLKEGNAFAELLVKNRHIYALAKSATMALNTYLFTRLFKKNKTLAFAASAALNLVLTYTVINNINMIQKARSLEPII